jgi:DNA-directed RNA polymerase subunit M/transcription elongation factor TFIIS
MSDSQLQAMADQVDDLTEIAQQVLRAEISRRGLDKQAPDERGEDSVPSEDDLTTVWTPEDSAQAQSVIGILETAGIRTCLCTEKTELVDGSFEDKQVTKVVHLDRIRALNVLYQYFPQEPDPEEDAVRDAVCPNCHARDITFQGLDAEPAPGVSAKYNWTCDACGHQWRDDGLEQLA